MSLFQLLPPEICDYLLRFISIFDIINIFTLDRYTNNMIVSNEKVMKRIKDEIEYILNNVSMMTNDGYTNFIISPSVQKINLSDFSLNGASLYYGKTRCIFQLSHLTQFDLQYVHDDFENDIRRHYIIKNYSKEVITMIKFMQLIKLKLKFPNYNVQPKLRMGPNDRGLNIFCRDDNEGITKGSIKDIHKADQIRCIIVGKCLRVQNTNERMLCFPMNSIELIMRERETNKYQFAFNDE